jgi:nucleotide-binding universal stress UspA family protein
MASKSATVIADILLHVDGTRAGENRIAYTLDIAKRHRASVTGLHVIPEPEVPPTFKPSMVEQVAAELELRLEKDATAAEQHFVEISQRQRVSTVWQNAAGPVADHICHAARTTDLVVLGQYERQGLAERHPLSLGEAVALGCGRPVLVVPGAIGKPELRRSLIAWDGSRAAVRAVHDALPLLADSSAEIVMIDAPSAAEPVDPLIEHLARHKVHVDRRVHLRGGPTADRLVERLERQHFDLLVMGAFGHAAWLEFLFNGTTQSVLMNSSVPVLISH